MESPIPQLQNIVLYSSEMCQVGVKRQTNYFQMNTLSCLFMPAPPNSYVNHVGPQHCKKKIVFVVVIFKIVVQKSL